MAFATYDALKTVTVTGSSVNYIDLDLTGLTTNYTHLDITGYILKTTAGDGTVRINVGDASLDSGSNYSSQIMYGNGSQGYADYSGANITYGRVSGWSGSSTGNTLDVRINNFRNTNFFKVIHGEGGNSAGSTNVAETLWRSTSPINIIRISNDGGNFDVGSTITVYGIAAIGATPAPKATGGTLYNDSLYYYHVFSSTGVFTSLQSISADILSVAGGGGGAIGGGGAGGLLQFSSQALTATNYTVTIGAGGTASTNLVDSASKGTNTQFGALTACVGGGSGGLNDNNTSPTSLLDGGSGGGSGGSGSTTAPNGTGTSGQGNNGGNSGGITASPFPGGGGGGGGAVGSNAPVNTTGGNGGIGATSSLINAIALATGTGQYNSSNGNYYFAGGGGGGGNGVTTFGQGGFGGGANASNVPVTNALPNMGGGGGGYNGGLNKGSNGGSGVVIVRYLKA
jgi:hypothetical protein